MKKQKNCTLIESNFKNTQNQYCKCEMMNRADELVVEVAKGREFLMQYNKRERQFALLLKEQTINFNQQLCPWCKQEIASL